MVVAGVLVEGRTGPMAPPRAVISSRPAIAPTPAPAWIADEDLARRAREGDAIFARLAGGKGSPHGLGWYVGRHAGRAYASHDGAWLGFLATYARFPADHLAAIVLLNRDYGLPDDDLAFTIADLYLDGDNGADNGAD